jgi:two-component sensor histidine kinase
MPQIPFLAAVLIAALRGGFAAGVTASVAGGVAANWVFIGAFGRFAFEADDLWASTFFVLFGLAVSWMGARLSATIRREADLAARLALVNGELQHRIKNIVAVVQSIVNQSARTATSAPELRAKVEDRLHAMTQALKLLTLGDEAVPLRELVRSVLEPFEMEGSVRWTGPDVSIPGEVALQLALLLHELATNASKYGSLSVPAGSVEVEWGIREDLTQLRWVETGGPVVGEPTRSGFGSRLVRAAVPDGNVRLDYRPEGVVCTVEIRRPVRP